MPGFSIARTLAMSLLPCLLLAACNTTDAYQYHGRLVAYRSGQPLKDTVVYAGPESGDPAHQAKTNDAGEFSGAFSTPASSGVPHRAPRLNRIDIHYLTPTGWVILHHALLPEDQDLTRKPAHIDLGTLPVPD